MNQNRTEWVMHVWGKKRHTLELNSVEKFHIDMLRLFQDQQKKFDKILINIALDDISDMLLFNFLKKEIGDAIYIDNVEFKYCQNEPDKGEYVTFRPYVFDRIGEDVDIFYSHFKGYGTYVKVFRESYPVRVIDLCEKFWSYIMYRYSLNMPDVQKKLKNNSIYCWYVFKNVDNKAPESNIGYYRDYQKHIQEDNEKLKELLPDDLCKHSPGSFLWYNMKNIGKSLADKPEVTSITTEYLTKHSIKNVVNLCTHFCEVYLMQFLKEDECYGVKDYNKEFQDMSGTPYTQIYPSKKIAREFIKDFEKYLIEKDLM